MKMIRIAFNKRCSLCFSNYSGIDTNSLAVHSNYSGCWSYGYADSSGWSNIIYDND